MSRFVPEVPTEPSEEILFGAPSDFRSRLALVADHIGRPLISSEPSRPMTFAIYGRWGAGKSTALRVLRSLLEDLNQGLLGADGKESSGNESGLEAIAAPATRAGTPEPPASKVGPAITVSEFAAPLWESFPDPRVSLSEAIAAEVMTEDLPRLVQILRRIAHEDARPVMPAEGKQEESQATLSTAVELHHALAKLAPAPPLFEGWLEEVARELRGHAPTGAQRAHVVLVDDLDRCSTEFTAHLLAAMSFWSRVQNLFFVVAASEDHLLQSLEEHMPLGPRTPQEALEKYIHLSIEVPPLLTEAQHVASFMTHLVEQMKPGEDERERDRLERLGKLIEESANSYGSTTGCLLAPLLRPESDSPGNLTPRAVKHRLNRFLAEFRPVDGVAEGQHGVDRRVVKRWVIAAHWPRFWLDCLKTVEGAERGDEWQRQLEWVEDLRRLGKLLLHAWGRTKPELQELVQYLAELRGGVQIPADVDANLAIYLAMEPVWEREAGEGPIGGLDKGKLTIEQPMNLIGTDPRLPSQEDRSPTLTKGGGSQAGATLGGPADEPLLLYVLAEGAMERGEVEIAIGGLRRLLAIVDDPAAKPSAATLGNGALLAEGHDDQLALALHHAALAIDPNHINAIQNFVDFVVRREIADLYPEAIAMLDRIESSPYPERLERVRALRLRLQMGQGESTESVLPQVKELVESLLDEPTLSRLVLLVPLLRDTQDRDDMRRYGRAVAEAATDDATRYRAIRLIADVLAVSDAERDEQEAADILLFCLSTGLPETRSPGEAADVKHNLATLIAGWNKPHAAISLWIEAYAEKPWDVSIRRGFASLLNNLDLNAAAASVLLGQTVDLPEFTPERVTVPFSASDVDRWWERLPIEPHKPITMKLFDTDHPDDQ